jgi:hypothetical protein
VAVVALPAQASGDVIERGIDALERNGAVSVQAILHGRSTEVARAKRVLRRRPGGAGAGRASSEGSRRSPPEPSCLDAVARNPYYSLVVISLRDREIRVWSVRRFSGRRSPSTDEAGGAAAASNRCDGRFF